LIRRRDARLDAEEVAERHQRPDAVGEGNGRAMFFIASSMRGTPGRGIVIRR
jgi:hypothetical protein